MRPRGGCRWLLSCQEVVRKRQKSCICSSWRLLLLQYMINQALQIDFPIFPDPWFVGRQTYEAWSFCALKRPKSPTLSPTSAHAGNKRRILHTTMRSRGWGRWSYWHTWPTWHSQWRLSSQLFVLAVVNTGGKRQSAGELPKVSYQCDLRT